MVIFEQFVYLRDGEVIYSFEFMDLFFKEDSLLRAYFIFIDDVDCSGHGGYFMDSFSEFIELVLFEAG